MMASRRSARLSTITQTTSKSISASAGGRALPTATVTGNDDGVVDDVATMQTPAKKRKLSHPPVTPTPALIGRMLERTPATVNKAVDLNHTASAHEISPERSLDSTTLLSKAEAHLIKVDPTLKRVIDAHHCDVFDSKGLSEPIDPFQSLAAGIMAQQISGAAANAVKTKFIGLFAKSNTHRGPPHFPPPSLVAAAPLATLKTAGLSQRKAEYIQGLAERFVDESLSKAMLEKAPDEKVMNTLVAVRGLGQWSVEMFCCFGLKRMDVFSTGDLGVQRGMAAYMGRDVNKLKSNGKGKWKYMSEKEMLEIAAKFSPYRSLFMWYMWRIESVIGRKSTDVAALRTTT